MLCGSLKAFRFIDLRAGSRKHGAANEGLGASDSFGGQASVGNKNQVTAILLVNCLAKTWTLRVPRNPEIPEPLMESFRILASRATLGVTWRFMDISGVISRVTIVKTYGRGRITPLGATHGPPSLGAPLAKPKDLKGLTGFGISGVGFLGL